MGQELAWKGEPRLYRRHLRDCKGHGCRCPVWVYGVTESGRQVRRSLQTTDLKDAQMAIQAVKEPESKVDEVVCAHAVLAVSSRNAGSGFIYFIGSERHVKIGFTRDVNKRLEAFNTASPLPLAVRRVFSGAGDLESELHGIFADSRLNGEWFSFGATVRAFISRTSQFDVRQFVQGVS